MPQRVHDRVKETTTTTGTGSITLAGAVSQFQSFAQAFAISEPVYYAIVGQTGTEWEVGRGYLLNSTTLYRVPELIKESSNRTGVPPYVVFSQVNFSAGTKDVFCTLPAARVEDIYTKGQSNAMAMGMNLP